MSKHKSPEDYLRLEVAASIHVRANAFGISEQCVKCPERCKMPRNPHHGTIVECFRHQGPLVAEYWRRRHREGRRAASNQQKRGALGASEARAPRQASPAGQSNGKEVIANDQG